MKTMNMGVSSCEGKAECSSASSGAQSSTSPFPFENAQASAPPERPCSPVKVRGLFTVSALELEARGGENARIDRQGACRLRDRTCKPRWPQQHSRH